MTKPIKAVIIEDEIPSARLLLSMLSLLRPEWETTLVSGNVEEAVAWFSSHPHPDIIFLDIHLSDGNAFDFLSAAKPSSSVIFTTAYDEYAIRAFSVNSIDYILKPVDEQRLSDAVRKYEQLFERQWHATGEYLQTLLDTLGSPAHKYRQRFLISSNEAYRSLQVDSIAYFYSEEKVTFAVTPSGKEHVIGLSLNKLEEQLDPSQFFRVNRQMIVNIDAVECAVPLFKGRMKVKVNPPFKSDILVSEGRASFFRLWLDF
ncbi:MAG: LytR/AlgR family response regulator transcription factor [Prevotella sp.]